MTLLRAREVVNGRSHSSRNQEPMIGVAMSCRNSRLEEADGRLYCSTAVSMTSVLTELRLDDIIGRVYFVPADIGNARQPS
jgi:hypothetical protein